MFIAHIVITHFADTFLLSIPNRREPNQAVQWPRDNAIVGMLPVSFPEPRTEKKEARFRVRSQTALNVLPISTKRLREIDSLIYTYILRSIHIIYYILCTWYCIYIYCSTFVAVVDLRPLARQLVSEVITEEVWSASDRVLDFDAGLKCAVMYHFPVALAILLVCGAA